MIHSHMIPASSFGLDLDTRLPPTHSVSPALRLTALSVIMRLSLVIGLV